MNEPIGERPEEIEEPFLDQSDQVTYTDDELKNKWFGVPPKGEVPVYNKWKYVLMLILVIVVEIGIWAVYRYFTGVVLALQFGDYLFYGLHIVFAPTIHLLPIILFWWWVRKERGLPFVFSKKLLLSGILIGFLAAIMWRLLEEFTYWGFASAVGGTDGPLTFLNWLETADLFIIMTFVMYFIVGPVEELEFRSFVQDQGARALTNIQAVILSSVLFGCSHIPIAVFVYKLPPTVFADALFGWIAAGFTFGFLYMWSRNIFACIVMHGMGNWQLSVFYFAALPGNMDPTTAMMVGMATSLVSNAIMIYVFYLIHKHYWEPHRRGEPAFGGRLLKLQMFIYDHDFGRKPLKSTVLVFVLIIFVVSAIIAGAAAAFGTLPMDFYGAPEVVQDQKTSDISDYIEVEEQLTSAGALTEGNFETIDLFSETDKYIKKVVLTVTWTDEADRNFRYENQPDTFSVSISGLNITGQESTAANPHGGQGTVSTELEFSLDDIAQAIDDGYEFYNLSSVITLVEAGNQEKTSGLPGLAWTDNSNSYEYTLDITYLVPPEE